MGPWFLIEIIISPFLISLHVTDSQNIAMYLQIYGLIIKVGMVIIAGLYCRAVCIFRVLILLSTSIHRFNSNQIERKQPNY